MYRPTVLEQEVGQAWTRINSKHVVDTRTNVARRRLLDIDASPTPPDAAIAAATAAGIPLVPLRDASTVGSSGSSAAHAQRRLLSTLRQTLTGATSSLTSLLPELDTSMLSDLGISGIDARQVMLYWSGSDRGDYQPALHVNGSMSLDFPPFNQFGLGGEVDVDFYVWPFYGPKIYGVPIPSSFYHLHLFASYELGLDFGGGVALDGVFVQLQTRVDFWKPRGAFGVSLAPLLLTVGGTMSFDVPDQDEPLLLTASVSMLEGSPGLDLNAGLSRWVHPFGIDGLVLESLWVKSKLGGAEFDLRIIADFMIDDTTSFSLEGFKQGAVMAFGVSVGNLTFRQIGDVCRKLVGGSPSSWEDNVILRDAFLGIANAPTMVLGVEVVRGVTFQATVDIYDFLGVQARIAFGSAGLELFAHVPEVPSQYLADGMTVGNLTLQVKLPTSGESSSSTSGGTADKPLPSVYVAGALSYKGLSFAMAVFLTSERQLLIGEVHGPSLSSVLSFVSGTPWDLKLDTLFVAFSPQMDKKYPDVALARKEYPLTYSGMSKGLLAIAEIRCGRQQPVLKLAEYRCEQLVTDVRMCDCVCCVRLYVPLCCCPCSVPYLDTVMGLPGIKAKLIVDINQDAQRISYVTQQARDDRGGQRRIGSMRSLDSFPHLLRSLCAPLPAVWQSTFLPPSSSARLRVPPCPRTIRRVSWVPRTASSSRATWCCRATRRVTRRPLSPHSSMCRRRSSASAPAWRWRARTSHRRATTRLDPHGQTHSDSTASTSTRSHSAPASHPLDCLERSDLRRR
jgi:hypothetical protein